MRVGQTTDPEAAAVEIGMGSAGFYASDQGMESETSETNVASQSEWLPFALSMTGAG